jgi:hypothetical protein
MRRQTQQARKYRRGLEALVVAAKGQVDAADAHLIDEAAAAEVHASVCRWLLRTRLDDMSVSDISRCSEQIVKAKALRNRAVERLGLNAQPDDWGALYTLPMIPSTEPATDGEGTSDNAERPDTGETTPTSKGT